MILVVWPRGVLAIPLVASPAATNLLTNGAFVWEIAILCLGTPYDSGVLVTWNCGVGVVGDVGL